jgi:hypothetical protein
MENIDSNQQPQSNSQPQAIQIIKDMTTFKQTAKLCKSESDFAYISNMSGLTVIREAIFTSVKCDLCTGKGHYAGNCATKKQIDKAVKYIPSAREAWRLYKMQKMLENVQLKNIDDLRRSLSKKKTKLGRKRTRNEVVDLEVDQIQRDLQDIADKETYFTSN